MTRFLISALYPTVLLPLYLNWARRQAEKQIDKMQDAAFNTPGAEAPIPPAVIVVGAAGLVGHVFLGRAVLKLSLGRTLLSLAAGAALGSLIGFVRLSGRRQP